MIARRFLVAAGGLATVLALAFPAAAPAARPLTTAVVDTQAVYGPQAALAMQRIRGTGARAVRLYVSWRDAAPQGGQQQKPTGFDAANPADPAYSWSLLDRQVQLAIASGLEPILDILDAPIWAQRGVQGSLTAGTVRPDPVEFGNFARAVALRYSGNFGGLPRVRYYQAWNEPNVVLHLSPQVEGGRYVSPGQYRAMLGQFAAAVHGVHADNTVIAGGLSAFTNPASTAPMRFMRSLLCMSKSGRPVGGCTPLRFDVWSMHPYTSGGPGHHARLADDVSLPDVPKMSRLLSAAVRARHVLPHGAIKLWVTEFSWDTTPPDPRAVPLRLHARWVAEALYEMWSSGVSLFTWFQLRDDAANGRPHNQVYESGLYFRCAAGLQCDVPKPSLTAFRFPFVAYRTGTRVFVWGRTPESRGGRVIVEQRAGRSWRRIAVLSADRYGIFQRRVAPKGGGDMRARLASGGATTLAFSLTRPRDRNVCSFGAPCGTSL